MLQHVCIAHASHDRRPNMSGEILDSESRTNTSGLCCWGCRIWARKTQANLVPLGTQSIEGHLTTCAHQRYTLQQSHAGVFSPPYISDARFSLHSSLSLLIRYYVDMMQDTCCHSTHIFRHHQQIVFSIESSAVTCCKSRAHFSCGSGH